MYWRNILGLESIKEDEGRIFQNNNPDKYTVGKSESPAQTIFFSSPLHKYFIESTKEGEDAIKLSAPPSPCILSVRNVMYGYL